MMLEPRLIGLGYDPADAEIAFERVAIVSPDGVVVNVCNLAPPHQRVGKYAWTPPEGHTIMPAGESGPGWLLQDGVLVEPSTLPEPDNGVRGVEPAAEKGDMTVL